MNNNKLTLTQLEQEVLIYFLEDYSLDREFFGRNFPLVQVTKRNITGVGFYTDLQTDKLFNEEKMKSLRWSKIAAKLNDTLDVGFVVYVDNSQLHCIEGYTYGTTAWPEEITSFKIIELHNNS